MSMDFPGEKFEPRHGDGNGHGDKEPPQKNAQEMLQSRIGAVRSQIERLKKKIFASEQLLQSGSREISDAEKEDREKEKEADIEDLANFQTLLEDLEEEMRN